MDDFILVMIFLLISKDHIFYFPWEESRGFLQHSLKTKVQEILIRQISVQAFKIRSANVLHKISMLRVVYTSCFGMPSKEIYKTWIPIQYLKKARRWRVDIRTSNARTPNIFQRGASGWTVRSVRSVWKCPSTPCRPFYTRLRPNPYVHYWVMFYTRLRWEKGNFAE